MYARVTQLEIDPVRSDVDTALELFKQSVVPVLKIQDGYAGVLALVTPEGKGLLASFWETEAQADASQENAFYSDLLSQFVTVFRAPPGRERYQVVFAEVPALVER